MIKKELVQKHIRRLVEVQVKGHTRHSKTGKAYQVASYQRYTDGGADPSNPDWHFIKHPSGRYMMVHSSRKDEYLKHLNKSLAKHVKRGNDPVTHDIAKPPPMLSAVDNPKAYKSALARQQARTERAFRKRNKDWEMKNRTPGKRYGWKP